MFSNCTNGFLEKLNADWYLVSTVNPQQIDPELRETFTQRARQILQDMDSHRPWVMKDPRLCLLLPLWLPLLEVPVCVHVVRHPLATARSLEKRDGFPLHFGMTLWEQYIACALLASSDLPRFSVCYEQSDGTTRGDGQGAVRKSPPLRGSGIASARRTGNPGFSGKRPATSSHQR